MADQVGGVLARVIKMVEKDAERDALKAELQMVKGSSDGQMSKLVEASLALCLLSKNGKITGVCSKGFYCGSRV